MILLDTNVVIYLHGGQLEDKISAELRSSSLDTCNIIIAEVLGYNFTDSEEAKYFENLFSTMNNYMLDTEVTNRVIELRKSTKVKLPDAIIAATALVNDLVLWTHNTDDFKDIPKLRLFDPIAT